MPADRSAAWRWWRQWVIANSAAELVGLGIVGASAYLVIGAAGEPESRAGMLGYAVLAVGLGGVEGAIVGYAQAIVLRRRLPALRSWVAATVAGAMIAWFLGMLPSTLMGLQSPTSSEPPPEMSDALQLALAVPLGMVAGIVLAFPQWRVLRRYVPRAGWWLPANALGWAVAMPLVFVAAGVRPGGSPLVIGVIVVASLAAAGAAAGAVHGTFLLWLVRHR